MRSALFAHMVMQQSGMAMMLLGKTAHPETGEIHRDLEAAKLFIDVLEMLEYKTKGNLAQEETALLRQTLMSLRMAFVEAVDSPPATANQTPDAVRRRPGRVPLLSPPRQSQRRGLVRRRMSPARSLPRSIDRSCLPRRDRPARSVANLRDNAGIRCYLRLSVGGWTRVKRLTSVLSPGGKGRNEKTNRR